MQKNKARTELSCVVHNIHVIRWAAFLVINPVTLNIRDLFVYHFNCTHVPWMSDSIHNFISI